MPPLADLQKKYDKKKDSRTDIARIVQNLLGQSDDASRFREVVNMSGPAFRVQNALGLISPEQAESRRLSNRNPERTNEVVRMSDPAFAVQNLLGMVDPEDAAARGTGGKRATGKVAEPKNITTATPSDDVRPARRAVRALTPEEEARTLGAPGSGGIPDATHRGDPRLPADPAYTEPDPYGINASYDKYLGMIDEMSGVYENLAQSNMSEIAKIFGETAGVAQGGMAPMADTYAQAQGNVGEIYDSLDQRLGGLSGELQGIAEGAAGSATGDVASMVEASIAPFEAASATAKANTQANLAQHSTAGQDYLSNLASASGEEGKMHASRVQAAADARAAEFDIRRMELEMAREEALREVAMDTAGQAAEREAMAALFGAAGVPLPSGLDMDSAQSYLNIGQDLGVFPNAGSGSDDVDLRSQLSEGGSRLLDDVLQMAERSWSTQDSTVDPITGQVANKGDRTQDFVFDVLAALDDQVANLTENQFVISPEMHDALREEELIRQIIRSEYGKF